MRSFQEHVDIARQSKQTITGELHATAVVGILDTRIKATVAPNRKGMGPSGAPPEIHRIAPSDMTQLWEPVIVESCLSLYVPLQFQGGGDAMLRKSQLKAAHELGKLKEILMAGQEPKLVGKELRNRTGGTFGNTISPFQ